MQAGRKPRDYNQDGCRLANLCDEFLTAKQNRRDGGELSALTFQDYHRTCKVLIFAFGRERRVSDIGPRDFERFRVSLAKTRNPTSVGDAVRRTRMVFKLAYTTSYLNQFGTGSRSSFLRSESSDVCVKSNSSMATGCSKHRRLAASWA